MKSIMKNHTKQKRNKIKKIKIQDKNIKKERK